MRATSIQSPFPNLLRLILIPMLLLGLLGYSTTPARAADSVIYVDASAGGDNNGSSWEDAFTSLQSALSPAPPSGTEIWVANGTYKPTSGTTQSATFTLLNDVAIYGGFAGTESLLSERNPKVNVSILSGDIGVVSNVTDNTYHLVTSSGTNNSAVLDGFTITGGNAVNDLVVGHGGGIYNVGGSPTLSNLIITGNNGDYGGGMFSFDNASPILTNVTFSSNTATERAGGMYNNLNSNATLTNVTFYSNTAGVRGGAMTVSGSTPTLTNVTFTGNLAPRGGAIHSTSSGNYTLINVTISGNIGYTEGGGIYSDFSTPVIKNTIFYNNTGGEIVTSNSTPLVTYSIVEGDYTGEGNQDVDPLLGTLHNNGGYTLTMALGPGSPAINAGTNTGCPSSDQRGISRPQDTLCDIGAYEFVTITVDSIVRADASPTSFGTVDFTVTFSANVTDVDTADFMLSTTGVNGASITGVSGSGDTYNVSVNSGSGNGTIRLDVKAQATIVDPPTNLPYTGDELYKIIKVGTFTDVPNDHWAWRWIESFYDRQITTGCLQSPLRYCPERQVTRAEMAVFILRAKYGAAYQPDPTETGMFADVPVTNKEWMQAWIEQFFEEGITTGCLQSPLRYCPERQVTRAEMAVFILRAKYGADYQPNPTQTGIFADVPVTNKEWMQAWIEQFFEEGITTGCLQGPLRYCPEQLVTRAEMAVFIDRAFGIPPLP